MITQASVTAAIEHLDRHTAQGLPSLDHEFNTLAYALSIACETVVPPATGPEVGVGHAVSELRALLMELL